MIIRMRALREILASNIEKAIKASTYNVRQIATELGVTETTIHRWKAKKDPIPPDVGNIEALAKLLDMDPMDFYKSEENVVPIYGNIPLRKYLVLPDEVVELAARVPVDFDWGGVLAVLEAGSPSKKGEKQA